MSKHIHNLASCYLALAKRRVRKLGYVDGASARSAVLSAMSLAAIALSTHDVPPEVVDLANNLISRAMRHRNLDDSALALAEAIRAVDGMPDDLFS